MKKNILLAILALVTYIALTESTLHIFPIDRCQVADFGTARSRDFYRFAEKPSGILYEHIPGAEGEIFGAPVRINSHGMRGAEISKEKPEGVFRIAILGDSVAFGYGVAEGEGFPVLLEKKLNEHLDTEVEMLNFSVVGYSTIQGLLLLPDKILGFDPDIIIIAHHLNDIYNPGRVAIAPSPVKSFFAQNSRLLGCFKIGHQLEARFIVNKKEELEEEFKGSYKDAYLPNSPIWSRHKDLLGWFGKISKEQGLPMVLILLPIFENFDQNYQYKEAHETLERAGIKAGLKVIDLSPLSVDYDKSAVSYRNQPNDPDHPNLAGHEKLSEVIYNGLLKEKLLPK